MAGESTQTTTIPAWTLGDRLRRARLSAGYNRPEDLAAAMKVSRQTIGNAEAGRRTPLPITLASWASVTNVSLDWLLTGEQAVSIERRWQDVPATNGGDITDQRSTQDTSDTACDDASRRREPRAA